VPEGLPRLLAIMGSGETAPTMSAVHRDLLARLGGPEVPAVLLDTPFGFQGNADDLSARAVEYFAKSVRRRIEVASFRSADEVGSLSYETMLNRLRQARYVFAGPGSPSYALAQWAATQVPAVLADKLRDGGCVTFASAAAVTLGPFALPVYEIYKVGQAPHWLPGLDLLGALGLPAVVVPHFDNAEGGTHDTRYCYMGERRLALLEAELPEELFVLGVDEHTACIFDLDAETTAVAGRGAVTVRRRGRMRRILAGTTVATSSLRDLAAGLAADTGEAGGEVHSERPTATAADVTADATAADATAGSPLLADVARLQSGFDRALTAGDPEEAVAAALALDELLLQWSRDTLESDELDRGRAALRSMLVRLGEAAEGGLRDPREVVGPFVDALLDARSRARADRRWADSDAIRDRLVQAGVQVHDSPDGTAWDLR